MAAGTGNLARTIVARLREQGLKMHCCAEPGPGRADGRPLGAQVRARRQRAKVFCHPHALRQC